MYVVNITFKIPKDLISLVEEILARLTRMQGVMLDALHVVWQEPRKEEE